MNDSWFVKEICQNAVSVAGKIAREEVHKHYKHRGLKNALGELHALNDCLEQEPSKSNSPAEVQEFGEFSIPQPLTFEEMENSSFASMTDMVIDCYVPYGQTAILVATTSAGKTILLKQCGRDVANGLRPEFLPPDCNTSVQMDVIYVNLEPRTGENAKCGFTSDMFPSNFRWVSRDRLPRFCLVCLLACLRSYCGSATRDLMILVDPVTKLPDFDAGKFICAIDEMRSECMARGIVLTMLCSAHLEELDDWKIAASKNIRGGDELIEQADSVFCLRKERRNGYRYIQVLKTPKGCEETSKVKVVKFSDKPYHFVYDSEVEIEDTLPFKPKSNGRNEEAKPKGALTKDKPKFELSDDDIHEIHAYSQEGPKTNISAACKKFVEMHNLGVDWRTVKTYYYKHPKEDKSQSVQEQPD